MHFRIQPVMDREAVAWAKDRDAKPVAQSESIVASLQKASAWAREHPIAGHGVRLGNAAKAEARRDARFWWDRIKLGRCSGEAEQAARRRFAKWFDEFALE